MLYQSITFNGKAPFSIYIFKLPTVYLTTFFLFQAKEFFEKSRLPIQESI